MGELMFARRLHPKDVLEQSIRGGVQEPDRRPKDQVKNIQRRADKEGRWNRLANGQDFWRLLAQRDVEEGNDRKRDAERDRTDDPRGADAEPHKNRVEQLFDKGFPDPAEGETRERDAELTGR